MLLPRPITLAILIVFGLYSCYAVYEVGYFGIITSHAHIAGVQVLSDLVIALILVMVWMVKDARERGTTVWPYILATLTLGSLGPLSYLLLRGTETSPAGTKSWA